MTYRQPSDLTRLRNNSRFDSVSKRGDVFTARKGFFYTNGCTADGFADLVNETIHKMFHNRKKAVIVDKGEVWKPFKGGAPVSQQSHWFVKFRLVDNTDLVETYNMLNPDAGPVMIKAYLKGTCCDPATETYHCM